MSSVRFILRNVGNEVAWVGKNTGLAMVRKSLYEKILQDANISYDADELLSLDNVPSDYIGASNAVKRNNVIFEIDSDRTTSPGTKLQIELIDVKIKVTQQNTIVSTALVNRRGSVKEYIQANDYRVEMRGSVISHSQSVLIPDLPGVVKTGVATGGKGSQNGFPINEVNTLRRILQVPSSIVVHSKYLQLFGITRLVYKSGDYDQEATKYANTLAFSLSFESDEDYDLIVE